MRGRATFFREQMRFVSGRDHRRRGYCSCWYQREGYKSQSNEEKETERKRDGSTKVNFYIEEEEEKKKDTTRDPEQPTWRETERRLKLPKKEKRVSSHRKNKSPSSP